ncbi:MAG: hypothetical protein J5911_03500 [Clostridia bacterium]|nr:hypothetical protein [Clostridia bacterium]
MNKFTFKYSPLIWVLLSLVTLTFAAAIYMNLHDAVIYSEDAIKFAISLSLATVSVVLLVLVVAAMICPKYEIKGKYLVFRFGLLYSRTKISDIFQLTEFKAQKKLVIYFKNEKYSVAMIDEKYYGDFYAALKKVEPEINYTVQSAEE